MLLQPNSQTSLESISLRFTQSNLPSSSLNRLSQDYISLTYTISLDNFSAEKLEFPDIQQNQDLNTSLERQTIYTRNNTTYRQNHPKEKDRQIKSDKDVFKKKPVLKVSNLDLSLFLEDPKIQHKTEPFKPKKTFIKNNNSGLFVKNKNHQEAVQPKNISKSKNNFLIPQPIDCSQTNSMLKSSRFFAAKSELPSSRKISFSIKKQFDRKTLMIESERKYKKFPLIRGSNFHSSAPASLNKKQKTISVFENAEACEKTQSNLLDAVYGKSCLMKQNDSKAKKYLQKVIQSRSNVIHFSDNKKSRIFKQFKQNLEEW